MLNIMDDFKNIDSSLETVFCRTREMAQQLRALAALAEDLGSVPSSCNSENSGSGLPAFGAHTYIHTYIHGKCLSRLKVILKWCATLDMLDTKLLLVQCL